MIKTMSCAWRLGYELDAQVHRLKRSALFAVCEIQNAEPGLLKKGTEKVCVKQDKFQQWLQIMSGGKWFPHWYYKLHLWFLHHFITLPVATLLKIWRWNR